MAERISYQYDQPYGDCSAIPTMLLAEASKKYITVALTGDGGDEAFGGYTRYQAADPTQGIIGYLPFVTVWQPKQRNGMMARSFLEQIQGCEETVAYLYKIASQYPDLDLPNQYMWLDTHTYLLNDILVKMDRASMAASVEARCPFLDHRVYELAFSLPGEAKYAKLILKEAFGDLIGTAAALRPKRGFGVPISKWFRSEQGKQLLGDMVTDICWPWAMFEPRQVASLLESHLQGRADYGHGIWMVLMLHMWLKRHFG
jgi:asparagine synthase (glutamine-hydrolysing)